MKELAEKVILEVMNNSNEAEKGYKITTAVRSIIEEKILEKVKASGGSVELLIDPDNEEESDEWLDTNFYDLPECIEFYDMGKASVYKVIEVRAIANSLIFVGKSVETGQEWQFSHIGLEDLAMVYDMLMN